MRLYTSEKCAGCKAVKLVITKNNLQGIEEVMVSTQESIEQATAKGIRTFPTLETDEGVLLRTFPSILKHLVEKQ